MAPLAGKFLWEEGLRGSVGWDSEGAGADKQWSTPGIATVARSLSDIDGTDHGGPGEESVDIDGKGGGGVFVCRRHPY